MQWTDEAIIIKVKSFSEKSSIVTVITKNYGLHCGFFRKKNITCGDIVQATWTARLQEHLGTWSFDVVKSCAAHIMHNNHKLNLFQVFCELLCEVLSERMVCPVVYEKALTFVESLRGGSTRWILDYLLLECGLLPRVGFVLDFSDLIMATDQDPLAFVSPRTGKVVTLSRGLPYKDKLLKFPRFLLYDTNLAGQISKEELEEAFTMTHYFFFKNADSVGGNGLKSELFSGKHKQTTKNLAEIFCA
jgi:DNA repair protein RecO (recombination protein O)